MLKTTMEIIASALKGDPTVNIRDRARILTALRRGLETKAGAAEAAAKPNLRRIVHRAEAAKIFGCSLRLIDRLSAQGALRKVRLPGRQRAAGFVEQEVLALMDERPDTKCSAGQPASASLKDPAPQ
jgi:hypothetical protein